MMMSRTTNGHMVFSAVSRRYYAYLLFAILLPLMVTACGVFTTPDTPANQRYWYDVGGMIVIHWDPLEKASSYAIHALDRNVPLPPRWNNPKDGPCILGRESGEYILIRCPESESNYCQIIRRSGENEQLSCSEFVKLRHSILIQRNDPLEMGETRSTTASLMVERSISRCTPVSPAVFVTACNFRGCSEIDTANPAQCLPDPDGPPPAVPTGFKAKKHITSEAPDDASVEWDTVDGATFYELWQGPRFHLADKIRSYGLEYDNDSNTLEPDGKIKPIYTPVNREIFGQYTTTSWKVRACTKAGCSPFSETLTID